MKTYYSHDISIDTVLRDVRRRTTMIERDGRGLCDTAFMRMQEKIESHSGSKRSRKLRRQLA